MPSFTNISAWFLVGVIWGDAVVMWVSGLGGRVTYIQWLFTDVGAWILVDVIRAGAAVTWVSSLNGEGVVGQLTISQHPCHIQWHGH